MTQLRQGAGFPVEQPVCTASLLCPHSQDGLSLLEFYLFLLDISLKEHLQFNTHTGNVINKTEGSLGLYYSKKSRELQVAESEST